MANCQYKIGFLTLRDCGNISTANCSSCNRPICDDHKHQANENILCVECYMKNNKNIYNENGQVNRVVIYNSLGYHPVYFGHHHGFGSDNYTYFDSTYAETGGSTQEVTSGDTGDNINSGDFQDS
jgi:hypothetical protein